MGNHVKIVLATGFVMACLAASPASAQVHSTTNATASGPVSARVAQRDPNRVVCVTEDVIGSRLGSKRRCMTAADWLAYRRDIRNTIERVQAKKIWNDHSDENLRNMTR